MIVATRAERRNYMFLVGIRGTFVAGEILPSQSYKKNGQHDESSGAQATQVSLYICGSEAGALARCRRKYHAAIAFV
jgi:hypothetical protein